MTDLNETRTVIALPDVRNWRVERDQDEIIWLALDCRERTTNTLSSEVLSELRVVLDAIIAARPRGLILYSAKSSGFAAGADIDEFERMTEPQETAAQIDTVHRLFERLEKLSFPTVARIHGFCLGGGLELALACRHIVAADESSTRLGFPEVLLGIHPGFGGSVRSIRTCGALAAFDLMLTGRAIGARRARRIGLIDRAVPLRHLDAAARYFATSWQPRREPKFYLRWLSHGLVRPVVCAFLRREVAKRAAEQHYPAPYSLIELWRAKGGDYPAMYRAEARSIARLLVTPTCKNFVRLFKLQERLKAFGGERSAAAVRVHVIGAGTMGGDIAAWCALKGMHVTLQDRAPKYLAPAMQRAATLFKKRIRDRYERLAAADRLTADFKGDGIAQADIIIEAIIEDVEAKRALFKELEATASADAILATNTSSIQLDDIATALANPERLIGIHFFNPVAQMQLVEIISTEQTDPDIVARSAAFTTAIDRMPLPAKSAPGFLINRVLSPYLQEAIMMLEEGVPASAIDGAAKHFGMPMGPLELADTVGLDICLHVGEILSAAFGGDVPGLLKQKVAQKRLGRKTNRGFYTYAKGKIVTEKAPAQPLAQADIRDRMLLRLLNEAVRCLREGIVLDADLVDVGMVFATGFAPFRGGPLHYARDRGVGEIITRLKQLEALHGARFSPDSGWQSV